jgi:FkbM family methyltransferase
MLFDIGSNIGAWALKNYNNNQIISVEASPSTFQSLVFNTAGKNIVCLNYAVTSSKEQTVEFFDCSANVISTLNQKWLNDPSSRFYNQFNYRKIRVNKI